MSQIAGVRRAAAFAPATPAPQQLRLGCSRRRAQSVVAMAGSGKVRSPAEAVCLYMYIGLVLYFPLSDVRGPV
jgi:hypothetical protein